MDQLAPEESRARKDGPVRRATLARLDQGEREAPPERLARSGPLETLVHKARPALPVIPENLASRVFPELLDSLVRTVSQARSAPLDPLVRLVLLEREETKVSPVRLASRE